MSDDSEVRRVPGLFRAWELEQIIGALSGSEVLRVEPCGRTSEGERLYQAFVLDGRDEEAPQRCIRCGEVIDPEDPDNVPCPDSPHLCLYCGHVTAKAREE